MSTQRICKWKQGISGRSPEGKIQSINFPCKFPNEELSSDLCTQCLLGDLFAMFYTQAMSFRKSADMQEEIMAFLKSFTSEDFDMR